MRIFILILTLLAYPLIAHGMIVNDIPDIAIILLVSLGLLSIVLSVVRGSKKGPDRLKIIIYTVIILWGGFNLLSDSTHVLFVPSVTINFIISLFVAASLRDGETPLMEIVIRMNAVAALPSLIVREARILTMIWSVFFLLMAVVSLVLAIWADLATWSLFANVLYFVFLGLLIFFMHSYQYLRYRKMGVPISWNSAYKLMRLYALPKTTDSKPGE